MLKRLGLQNLPVRVLKEQKWKKLHFLIKFLTIIIKFIKIINIFVNLI